MKLAGVTAVWDRSPGDPRAVLVLGHGAGGDHKDPLLRGVAERLKVAGVACLRFNFPYREAGNRPPGSQAQSEDAYRAIASSAAEVGAPLFCGGKSYGGRIATHIVAEGFPVAGLVLFSYPLHPPGRPERIRDAHLGRIGVPMLFFQGTKDPFAQPELLAKTMKTLRTATLEPVEGGDHSLNVRGTPREVVVESLAAKASAFIEEHL